MWPVCGRKGSVGAEKEEKQTLTPGSSPKEAKSPLHLALKTRGAKFCEFLQLAGLKAWNLKN